MNELRTAPKATNDSQKPRTRWSLIAVAVGLICLMTKSVFAVDVEPDIIRIEEDWIVEITSPDPDESSPQIITSMSSTDELADVHAVFELNHRTLPNFADGGMEIQLWSHDELIDLRVSPKTAKLSYPNETIYYTMAMELKNGNVDFEARDGYSDTWNEFGHWNYLKVGTTTTQTRLNFYDPEKSVSNSRIGFAKHRVNRFGMLRVRYYTYDNVLVHTDYTDRMVHVLAENP
ncbi:MAG: hypothetical protein O2955_00565 [Planctomycetota bacterium]|nr:hypothetical protein [Planctomycetota bacterium]MDA1210973.1 hypothetical protein [Planctomycetota bacterium]